LINVEKLSRYGFIPDRFSFAVRTAPAACLALLVAWLLGLEHPQWSAMTVFAASQPTRMQLFEKSFFRAAGTLAGTVLGVILVVLSGGEHWVLVLGLSAWIGFCVFAGNLIRGFASYGVLLAGFSAAMVALLDTAHPDKVFALGGDSLLTVLTGVVVAAVIGLVFAPRQAKDAVVTRLRGLTASALKLLAAGQVPADDADGQRRLLRELAAVEEELDQHGAGSIRARRSVRSLRAIVWSLVDVLIWLRHGDAASIDAQSRRLLTDAAEKLDADGLTPEVVERLEEAGRRLEQRPTLHAIITRTSAAVSQRIGITDDEKEPAHSGQGPKVILHRDWIGAQQASMRATGVMLLLGLVWLATGWAAGPLLLLGASVMASIFSTWENPALIMRYVVVGQMFGAAAALACHWLVWPYASSEFEMVLMLMPFMLLGILPLSHRRTMFGAIDYCMALLLLSQPVLPLTGTFGDSLSRVAAVIAGPLIALVAYRYAFPTNASRRLDMLVRMMVRELQDIARDADALDRREVWHARMSHRLLRAISLTGKAGRSGAATEEGGITVFALGSCIFRLRQMQRQEPVSPAISRATDVALRRLQTLEGHPARVLEALDRLARRRAAEGLREDGAIRSAQMTLRQNLDFFFPGEGR
jgi:uncharacterized membrane protein YccC